jgi:hypothetical protein
MTYGPKLAEREDCDGSMAVVVPVLVVVPAPVPVVPVLVVLVVSVLVAPAGGTYAPGYAVVVFM